MKRSKSPCPTLRLSRTKEHLTCAIPEARQLIKELTPTALRKTNYAFGVQWDGCSSLLLPLRPARKAEKK
jgi:hypothetical protein